jgi:hypothetical protein
MKRINLSELAKKWPSAYVAREEVGTFTGGIVSPKYMANIDCTGEGPEGAIKVGRKVAYPVDCFVRWLENRAGPR